MATDKSHFSKKAKVTKMVHDIWKGFLLEGIDLLKVWKMATKVLVGIG